MRSIALALHVATLGYSPANWIVAAGVVLYVLHAWKVRRVLGKGELA